MSDLIERLRALKTLEVYWEQLACEAADEIERLTAENRVLQKDVNDFLDIRRKDAERIEELEDERKWLACPAEFKALSKTVKQLRERIAEFEAENRALRSAFASLRDRLTELSVDAEDAVIAINMASVSAKLQEKP
jgi:seryl-tRNA synthetase